MANPRGDSGMVIAYALASILVLEAWRGKNQATLEFEVQHAETKEIPRPARHATW